MVNVSGMDEREFLEFLYKSTELRNALDGGISYLDSEFRRLDGQEPLDIKKYTVILDERRRADMAEIKRLAEETAENIAFVVRYRSGELKDIYHLPAAASREAPYIKKVFRPIRQPGSR